MMFRGLIKSFLSGLFFFVIVQCESTEFCNSADLGTECGHELFILRMLHLNAADTENPEESEPETCPGTECRLFITQDATIGNFGGIADADTLCLQDPANPDGAGNGNWKALLVDDDETRRACETIDCGTNGIDENIDWVLYPDTAYRSMNTGIVIGNTNAAAIFELDLVAAIGEASDDIYWTGLDWNNQWLTGTNCTNWTYAGSLQGGGTGDQQAITYDAFGINQNACDYDQRLLCVEQ